MSLSTSWIDVLSSIERSLAEAAVRAAARAAPPEPPTESSPLALPADGRAAAVDRAAAAAAEVDAALADAADRLDAWHRRARAAVS